MWKVYTVIRFNLHWLHCCRYVLLFASEESASLFVTLSFFIQFISPLPTLDHSLSLHFQLQFLSLSPSITISFLHLSHSITPLHPPLLFAIRVWSVLSPSLPPFHQSSLPLHPSVFNLHSSSSSLHHSFPPSWYFSAARWSSSSSSSSPNPFLQHISTITPFVSSDSPCTHLFQLSTSPHRPHSFLIHPSIHSAFHLH